ncbi:MAG: HEAT repeat domain-containing protein [Candidatus Heimdallarchaeota archaeon]|nr:HEAT repeat domain-containing protein [Candidatus Heimdallarchaeota archaeon]
MTPKQYNHTIGKKIETLLHDMQSVSSYHRAEAIKQIGNLQLSIQDIPLEVHKKLELALRDPEPEVRSEAIMALAFLEQELALPLLEPLFDDQSDLVKGRLLAALSYIGVTPNPSLTEKLIAYLNYPNEEIRDRCARALGRLKIKNSKLELLNLVKNDPSEMVRAGAVAALGMIQIKDNFLSTELEKLLEEENSRLVKLSIKETLALLK